MSKQNMTRNEARDLQDSLPKSRAAAFADGSMYYFTGSPCANEHLAPRKAFDSKCIDCLDARRVARQESLVYRSNDKPKAAERRAANKARSLGLLPDDYDPGFCLLCYQLAEKLTEESGIAFEVDHNIPLNKIKRGYHHHENLIVMQKTTNRQKGALTFQEFQLKCLVTDVLGALAYGRSKGEFIGASDLSC